jgi:hypothetical protein
MSELVDAMLEFFENAKNNGPVAPSVKEDLVMRAAQVQDQPFKQFDQAADEEIRFNRVCALLKDELEKLELHLESTDGVEYSPEVDRYMRWVQMVRSEMSQIPRTYLTADLKKILDSKRRDATDTQLKLMALKPVGVGGGVRKVERKMAEWHIVVQEFLREHKAARQVLYENWAPYKSAEDKDVIYPEPELKELLLSNPAKYVGDIEFDATTRKFSNQEMIKRKGGKGDLSGLATKRKGFNTKVDVRYVKDLLNAFFDKPTVDNMAPLFAAMPEVYKTEKIVSQPTLESMEPTIKNSLHKSHRHALEVVSGVTSVTVTRSSQDAPLTTLFKTKGTSSHLDVLLDRFIEEEEKKKAPDDKKDEKREKRAIFEVEVLNSLLYRVGKLVPEDEQEAAKAAINSSIEAFMLYTQYAGTPPDQEKAFKDPATLLRVQGLNTSYVKSLSDKEGYRVVFQNLDMKEEPDVHTLGHQTLNPFLLDKMHRSEEFKTALLRAAENYIAHAPGRASVLAMLQRKNANVKGIKLTRGP